MKSIPENAGYTLIEILIVLFIISIVTSVALLSIGRNENKRAEAFANELSQMVTLAEEEAMLQPSVYGLQVNDNRVQFFTLQPAINDKKAKWIPTEDSILGKRRIPDDVQIDVEINGKRYISANDETKNIPQIIISTNGDITPFTIYVGRKDHRPRYMIKGEADGNVTNKKLA